MGNGSQGGDRKPKKSTPIDIRRVPPVATAFKPITQLDMPKQVESASRSLLYLAIVAVGIAAAMLVYSLSR